MGLADRTAPTAEEYATYRKRFSNWGRWGADDELGTLNFITPAVRRGAAALVRECHALSLSRPVDTHAGPANPYPAHHFVAVGESGGMLDYVGLFIHGITNTHIDALCHLPTAEGDAYYNGAAMGPGNLPARRKGTIEHWRHGVVTRGVLYDVPRLRGTEYVAPGRPVHGWELADAADAQGIEPEPGDAVLIRCGADAYFAATGPTPAFGFPAGVHASAVEFLYETQAALLCWDFQDAPTADQGLPNPMPIPVALHVHHILLPYMGMPIVDNANLEELARTCAQLGRYAFQFVVAPLLIEGGTGSPVNPLAVL
jgi:kynurenine formamidase